MPPSRFLALILLAAPGLAWAEDAPTVPRLNPDQAREDVQLAIDVVEAALPDIHWRQSAADWDAAKARALAQAARVEDPMQLYAVVAPLMSGIGEGHLAVYPSRAAVQRESRTASVLPLDLHWSTEGVFVRAAYGEAADIPPGSELLDIDGEGYEPLLAELMAMTPHDGDIRTGPMRDAAGGRYAVLRQRLRGDEPTFDLRYQTPDGRVVRRTVAAFPLADHPDEPDPERTVATLEWLEPGLAYLRVPTFSNRVYREAHADFRDTMRRLFEELRRGRAERLILDLRENGGGSEPNEAVLFSYLVAQPMRRYAAVEARAQDLEVASRSGQVFAHRVFDEDEMNFQRRLPDGRLTRLNVPPEGLMSHWAPSDPVFEGRLAVLAGGYTFSGGAELASMLRHARRGVFVGEEVGGAHEGNTSGYQWEVALPNSGVRLLVPLLQFRFDWPGLPRNRGVQPDCDVPPLVGEIGERRDRAWRVARAVVKQDWRRPEDAVCPAVAFAEKPAAGRNAAMLSSQGGRA